MLLGTLGSSELSSLAAVNTAKLNEDLIFYTDFSEVEGDSLKDQSGLNHNGQIHGDITFVDGISGKAAYINNIGDNAGQDDKQANQYIALDGVELGTDDFTISLWVKGSKKSSNSALLGNKNFRSGGNLGVAFGKFSDNASVNMAAVQGKRCEVKGMNLSDEQWHQITGVADRDKNLTVYMDGVQYSSPVAIGTYNGKTLDTEFPMVIGSGGNLCNGVSDLYYDEVRIYNKALSADEVGQLYQRKGKIVSTTELLAQLDDMQTSPEYTAEMIQEVKAQAEALLADLKDRNVTDAEAANRITAFEQVYQNFMKGSEPIASFDIISDVHVGASNDTNAKNLAAGLKGMKALDENALAVVNLGDFTQNGKEAQYDAFYEVMKASAFKDEEILIALGNHDVRGEQDEWNQDDSVVSNYWSTAKELYMERNKRYNDTGKLYYEKELGGYHFIVINTENGLKDAMYLSDEQLQWLDTTLAEASKSGKPIFVFGHNALDDTHWRSNTLNGFGNQAAQVKAIFRKYPQVIYFSGHIHNGFGVVEAVDRDFGTSVDVPSFNETENGVKDQGVGYHVKIYDDMVILKAVNFITGEYYTNYDITLSVPGLAEVYQHAKALKQSDYTVASWEPLGKLLDETEKIFGAVYDQSALKWNTVTPPENPLFGKTVRERINALTKEIPEAEAQLVKGDGGRDTTKPINEKFVTLREKFVTSFLGGELNMDNSAVQTYVKNLNQTANDYWSKMSKSDQTERKLLWDDLDMSYIKGTGAAAKINSGNIATTFQRLEKIATAWATEGCDLYQNQEVRDELISALNYMYENHYNESDDKTPVFGNWWHWEIGGPIAFLRTALILYDDLTLEEIKNYTNAVDRFTKVCDKPSGYPGSPAMTGANLIDKGMAVVEAALLTDNADKLEHVRSAYKTVFAYVTTGDGFYRDGSFIQHQALAYMGGYGASLYEKLSVLFSVLKDSDWELSYDDGSEQLIFDMIFEGIEPLMYDANFMDMASGRDITRKGSSDRKRGVSILSSIMLMGDAMPTDEARERFKSMVKYFVGIDEDFFFENCGNIAAVVKADEIMSDDSIAPRSDYLKFKLFGSMDKAVQFRAHYGVGISMHSSRTYGHELINDEGKKTWNISDGMLYLYNNDRDQYRDGYWATVDPKRLPGTTSEYVDRANGAGDRTKNIYPWVGGAALENFGAVGMHYRTLGNSGSARSGADVKKSWFLFDDEIVALGSGITSTTGNKVETIVENRKLKADGSNKVLADGTAIEKNEAVVQPSWMHLEGNVDGSDIGYYFPEKTEIHFLRELRKGNWSSQGTTTGEEQNRFATFWFEHGAKPKDASYEYVLLPGKDAGETADYAATPDIEVVQNTAAAQAVKEKTLGYTAVNFWEAGTAAGITSDKEASVMMHQDGDEITVSVADPTQKNTTITLILPVTLQSVIEKDENIEVVQSEPYVKLSVNTNGLAGASSELHFIGKAVEKREIVGLAEKIPEISVPEGTAFKNLPLPSEVKVTDSQGNIVSVSVEWERGDYKKNGEASYHLYGKLVLPENLFNSAGIQGEVDVTVGNHSVIATDDAYVVDGTHSKENHGSEGTLLVKDDATSYYRKAYLKFSLADVPKDSEQYLLQFKVTSYNTSFADSKVYEANADWTEDKLTYETAPARLSDKAVGSFTKSDVDKNDGVIQIDVTASVKAAFEDGRETVSFELVNEGRNSKNDYYVYSKDNTTSGAVKPSLLWSVEVNYEKVTTSNLSFIVKMAESIEAETFSNVDEEKLAKLIADAKAVIADPDADMNEIHECEKALTIEMSHYRKK